MDCRVKPGNDDWERWPNRSIVAAVGPVLEI
jgi:hypothetical protein